MKPVVSPGRVSLGPEGFSEEVMSAEARPGSGESQARTAAGCVHSLPTADQSSEFPSDSFSLRRQASSQRSC